VKTLVRTFVAECRGIFLDPGAALILVGALALYAFFYPMPYLSQVLKHVPVIVVDQDQSDLSRKLVRLIDADELTHVAGEASSLPEAESLVRAGRAGGVILIPAEFDRKIRRGDQAYIAAYADASYFLVYRQVLTGTLEATGTLSAGVEIKRLVAAGAPVERAMKARDPLPLVMRPLFNPTEGYASYVVPAVLVLILQQTLLVGIGLVSGTRREKQTAVIVPSEPRLPLFVHSFLSLVGRTLAYFLLYLVHCLFYFGIVYRLFSFPQQASALTLARFAAPFLLSVIFLGLTLRSVFRTREMALQVLLFTSLPALFTAGFAWPVEALPVWIATFSKALPSTSAIGGFLRLTTMGASLPQVGREWMMLWTLTGVYFVCAWVAEAVAENRSASINSASSGAVTGLDM
jgi:ABC-2 type transport system permease protein